MNLREFLRGGYQTLDDITVVSNHGRPVFTVHPHSSPPGSNAYGSNETVADVEVRETQPPARGRTRVR